MGWFANFRAVERIMLACVLCLTLPLTAAAQERALYAATDKLLTTNAFPDTVPQGNAVYDDEESAPQQPAVKLLPEKLSLVESSLWGEKGLFRITGLAPLNAEARKSELNLRRTMLTAHQIGGFVTLASMLTTCYFGQRVIDGRTDLGDVKSTLAGITILSYTITGLLALLSPPPLIKRDEEGTTATHKAFAWGHVLGMVITPILADQINERVPGSRKDGINLTKARVHQISGYLTTALFAGAMISVTF